MEKWLGAISVTLAHILGQKIMFAWGMCQARGNVGVEMVEVHGDFKIDELAESNRVPAGKKQKSTVSGNSSYAFVDIGDVTFRDVGKIYHSSRDRPVLSGISAQLKPGTFTSFLGPSGCGKSTLLNLVAGLDKPSFGSVFVHGFSRSGIPDSVAFVFQDAALYPWRNALENVVMPLEGKVPKGELRERGLEQLRRVGLRDSWSKRPHELSGGMKQRVMLARAFLTKPAILLLDEPFGALDALSREVMQIALLDLWVVDKPTILFVTHGVDEAVFLSQRVIVLSSNPAQIVKDAIIDEPYPRSQEFRFAQGFTELCKDLHGYLHSSVT